MSTKKSWRLWLVSVALMLGVTACSKGCSKEEEKKQPAVKEGQSAPPPVISGNASPAVGADGLPAMQSRMTAPAAAPGPRVSGAPSTAPRVSGATTPAPSSGPHISGR